MRILHVTYSLAADQGGPTMVTTRVAAAQAGLGHDVTILTRESAGPETPLPPIAGSARVKIERLKRSAGGRLRSGVAKVLGSDSKPVLRELIARHDVVHVHNIWDPILIHAVNEARRQKKPVVLSPHGILTRWALSEKRLKKKLAMPFYRPAIEKVSLVHALSSFEREELAVFGFKGPVVVVPNGVFLEEIDPLPRVGAFYEGHREVFGEGAEGQRGKGAKGERAAEQQIGRAADESKDRTPSVIAASMTPPPLGKGEETRAGGAAGQQGTASELLGGEAAREDTSLPPTPSLREGNSEEREPFVLFLSRLHPIKGLDLLVEAFARVLQALGTGHSALGGAADGASFLPNAKCQVPGALPRLVIVGPDFGMEAKIREQAARLGIADRVHLTGPIFGRGKYEAMVDCACFCLPSGHEAFSVAIAEAMACRAAVVISPECHLPEAEEAGAGLVVEREVDKLAAALETILSDEPGKPGSAAERRRAMGERGRRLVEERFTWERVAGALVEAYGSAQA